uniref:Uncharacterized protein n=1 Tax=Oryza sativa subsp. japonica TaxID=39947 RepID=Q75IN1_ORYSJ|nr:hypothetical protein [Oryza sativa Japonica Group]
MPPLPPPHSAAASSNAATIGSRAPVSQLRIGSAKPDPAPPRPFSRASASGIRRASPPPPAAVAHPLPDPSRGMASPPPPLATGASRFLRFAAVRRRLSAAASRWILAPFPPSNVAARVALTGPAPTQSAGPIPVGNSSEHITSATTRGLMKALGSPDVADLTGWAIRVSNVVWFVCSAAAVVIGVSSSVSSVAFSGCSELQPKLSSNFVKNLFVSKSLPLALPVRRTRVRRELPFSPSVSPFPLSARPLLPPFGSRAMDAEEQPRQLSPLPFDHAREPIPSPRSSLAPVPLELPHRCRLVRALFAVAFRRCVCRRSRPRPERSRPTPSAIVTTPSSAVVVHPLHSPSSLHLLPLDSAPPNPTLETDSGGRVDALFRRNRTPVAPSPFPPFLAAECRRRNPPPSSIPWRIQAVGSSPLNPCYLPVCSLSPVPPWFAPPFAAAVRRPFRPTPSSTSRRPAWQSRRRHVGATSARTGSSRPRPTAPLRIACARGPPRAVRLRVGPPHPRPLRAAPPSEP